jgi:hypothetical protein
MHRGDVPAETDYSASTLTTSPTYEEACRDAGPAQRPHDPYAIEVLRDPI